MADPDGFLDTSVIIDLWRGSQPALDWLRDQSDAGHGLSISVIVAMEFMDGARNQQERQRAISLLKPYSVWHLTPEDSRWAQAQHAAYKLSHNVGILDALIAAPAARLGVPIYTLNVRHFNPLPDVTVIKPY